MSNNRLWQRISTQLVALQITRKSSCQCLFFHFRTQLKTLLDSSLNLSLESYVTTDGQSASLSWYKAPIWAYDQIFIAVRNTEYV
jgi:hypothetical protein